MIGNNQYLNKVPWQSFKKSKDEIQNMGIWIRSWSRYIDVVLFGTFFSFLLGNLLIIYSSSTLDKISDPMFIMIVFFL